MCPPLAGLLQPRISLTGPRCASPRPFIRLLRWCGYHTQTAVLFTISDFKTILLPIVRFLFIYTQIRELKIIFQCAFASATAPLNSPYRLLLGAMWVWIHLFMCNVSNQARTHDEDAVNKPWRPLPARRISDAQIVVLRWMLVVACFAASALHGVDLMLTTLGLFLTTFAYDEFGLAGHCLGKNLCNIGGYTTFEIGATKLMGKSSPSHASGVSHCETGCARLTLLALRSYWCDRFHLRPRRHFGHRGVYQRRSNLHHNPGAGLCGR